MSADEQPPVPHAWRNLALGGGLLIVVGLVVAKACSPESGGVTAEPNPEAAPVLSAEPVRAPPSAKPAMASASAPAPDWKPPTLPADRWGEKKKWGGSFEEQNAHLLDQLVEAHRITGAQRKRLAALIAASERIGQGNPAVTRHPVTSAECRKKLADESIEYQTAMAERICGGRYMAPLYDPETEKPEQAKACIDQFEFPNIPCSYPVTWVRANEAAEICEIMGKRICDAHEWEGACYGALKPPDYNFGIPKRMGWEEAVKRMRTQHNINVHDTRKLAYGRQYKPGYCATGSRKSDDCGLGWRRCGSNTYPAGFFPACTSRLGVYDIHGNAAEHMNLPLAPEQMASAKNTPYGRTEMKGSWFIFDQVHAHEDHCRWRAPHWHGTRITNPNSHRNYHLGFRCCKSLP